MSTRKRFVYRGRFGILAALKKLFDPPVAEPLPVSEAAPPEGPHAAPQPKDPISDYQDALEAFRRPAKPARPPAVRRVVMLATSELRIDPRIEREARALAGRGFEVVVVGPDLCRPPHAEKPLDWGPGVSFDLLPPLTISFIVNPPYVVCDAMTEAAARHAPFAVHGHDHWTSFIAMQVAERTGARLVVDYHEWGSENVSWDADKQAYVAHPPAVAEAFRTVEIVALRRAHLAITVNKSIAQALDEMAGLPADTVQVIRNIPPLTLEPTRPYPPLKQQLGLPESTPLVLYQGGTGPSRLLEPVIQALAHAPGVTLAIRGPSLDMFGDDYRAVARDAGVLDRLILRDAVPSRDVVAAARGADAGVWTLPDLSANFRLALPNKIFEYLAAGLPVALANYPEASRVVRDYGCGVTFDPYDPKSIGAALTSLVCDSARRQAAAAQVSAALDGLRADREWEKFADLYDALWAARETAL